MTYQKQYYSTETAVNILIFVKFEFFFKSSEEPGQNYWYK